MEPAFGQGAKGLGEMFAGDFADMCADKFPLMLIGAEQRALCAEIR